VRFGSKPCPHLGFVPAPLVANGTEVGVILGAELALRLELGKGSPLQTEAPAPFDIQFVDERGTKIARRCIRVRRELFVRQARGSGQEPVVDPVHVVEKLADFRESHGIASSPGFRTAARSLLSPSMVDQLRNDWSTNRSGAR